VASISQAPVRPPRQRSRATEKRGAPRPNSPAGGSEGAEAIRQRVAAAEPVASRRAAPQEACRAALLAGQLQPASGGQVGGLDLTHHGGDADSGQGVFHDRQALGLVAGADLDQPLQRKPQPRQSRRPEVIAPQHPDHFAPHWTGAGERCDHQGGEGGRRGGGLDLHADPTDLVPATERQAAAGQASVYPPIPERQHATVRPGVRLDGGDLRPQGGAKIGHGFADSFRSTFVLVRGRIESSSPWRALTPYRRRRKVRVGSAIKAG
jgi:hypothetical protein